MTVKFIKPLPGKRVPDPVTKKPLPAEGKNREYTAFWKKRKREGDVTVSEAKKPAKPSKITKKD